MAGKHRCPKRPRIRRIRARHVGALICALVLMLTVPAATVRDPAPAPEFGVIALPREPGTIETHNHSEPEPSETVTTSPAPEPATPDTTTTKPAKPPPKPKPPLGLTRNQWEHAKTIVATGRRMGVPRRGLVVAVATGMQESKLRMYANAKVPASLDLPHTHVGSDHDSVGLFQQRPNWGSVADRMNPVESAERFYAALREIPGWHHLPVTVAAQTVQNSAFPGAYAQWAGFANRVVTTLEGMRHE
jgi:hypothetical protein